MKLYELLKSYPEEQEVKIGSGSGFFYIGNLKDIFTKLHEINNDYFAYYEELLNESIIRLTNIDDIFYKSYFKKLKIEEGKRKKHKKYMTEIEVKKYIENKKVREIKRLQKVIPKYDKYLNDWTELVDREVIDEYNSIISLDTIIIIIEGIEHGEYWYKGDPGTSHDI